MQAQTVSCSLTQTIVFGNAWVLSLGWGTTALSNAWPTPPARTQLSFGHLDPPLRISPFGRSCVWFAFSPRKRTVVGQSTLASEKGPTLALVPLLRSPREKGSPLVQHFNRGIVAYSSFDLEGLTRFHDQ